MTNPILSTDASAALNDGWFTKIVVHGTAAAQILLGRNKLHIEAWSDEDRDMCLVHLKFREENLL